MTQISLNLLMPALCLNVHAETQHVHIFIKVQKKLPMKKKDVGKRTGTHHKRKRMFFTAGPVIIVFIMLQGLHAHPHNKFLTVGYQSNYNIQ